MRTNQPNLENAACEREMIFLALSGSSELKFQLLAVCKCTLHLGMPYFSVSGSLSIKCEGSTPQPGPTGPSKQQNFDCHLNQFAVFSGCQLALTNFLPAGVGFKFHFLIDGRQIKIYSN